MIYLARHGQDEDNANGILNGRRNTPLTETGIAQAYTLAENIKERQLQIESVHSSPLQRAYGTAEIIAAALDLPAPTQEDLLIERDFGVMTGKRITDIKELCAPDIIQADPITYFLSPAGAETFPQLIERSKKLLRKVAAANVLLVTHGDIGKMLYTAFYDLDWKDVLTEFHFGNSEVLLLAHGTARKDRHLYTTKQHNH